MKNINQTISEQIHHLLSSYQHILHIHSIKDFKGLKPLQNLRNHSKQYLRSTVQKLLLLTQQPRLNYKLFISEKPYQKPSGKLVYLFSYNNSLVKLLTEYDPQTLGVNVIQILKTIYNDIFSEDQSPPADFQTIIEYVIDHEEQLSQNHKTPHEMRTILQSFTFIIRHNLSLRAHKSFSLSKLLQKLQPSYFHQLIIDSLKACPLTSDQKYLNKAKLYYLCRFLSICTKAAVIVYPAKRTLDSKAKVETIQTQEHFVVVNVHTQQTPKPIFRTLALQDGCTANNNAAIEMSQLMFSFMTITEDNSHCLLIQLKSDFKISATSFVLFESFYESLMEKYELLYLDNPFQSAFESNMRKIRIQFSQKQSRVNFNYITPISNRQSIIIEFIKCVDILILMYLVLEEYLIKIQNQLFIQKYQLPQTKAQIKYLREEMAQNLYRETKGYLERLTVIKRKVICTNYG